MSKSFRSTISEKPSNSTQFGTPIQASIGAHNAYMIGFSEPWTQNDSCFNRDNQDHGSDCRKCQGTGVVPTPYISIHYRFPDGHVEQERVSMKISSPKSFTKNGQFITTKASKLYERLVEFSKDDGNDPANAEYAWGEGQLADWADAHQSGAKVPVLVIIKQPNKYPKIVEVLYRAEQQPMTTRTGANTHREFQFGKEEHPFTDEDETELPF